MLKAFNNIPAAQQRQRKVRKIQRKTNSNCSKVVEIQEKLYPKLSESFRKNQLVGADGRMEIQKLNDIRFFVLKDS